jgi:catechol 2,3-dioxygenase-like lactoylglutathione lyase family enzyme
MAEQIVPIFKVADAIRTAEWYARLGFETEFVHRYSEEFPAYVGLSRKGLALHLSEHAGDATPDSLVYLFVDDVDAVAAEFGVEVADEQWAREIQLTDPDGNRLRIGTRKPAEAPAEAETVQG